MSERDPDLEALLGADSRGAIEAADLDAMFSAVRGRVEAADRRPAFFLRSRPTWLRRAMALAAFVVVGVISGLGAPRPDLAEYPIGRMAIELAALGVLLGTSLWLTVRPLHEPAMSRGKLWALAGLALASTLVLALLPQAHAHLPTGATGDRPLLAHAMPCMGFGLALGLPVYAIARLLDRGARLGALMAGVAAGLAGNFALQLHCPIAASDHLMAGHVTVLLAFVVGVLLVGGVERRLRGSRA